MRIIDAFPTDYISARKHFLFLSQQLTDRLTSYPVCTTDETLSIDVSLIGGSPFKRTLIVSSGLHGVEGFVGSAIQISLLQALINGKIDLSNCRVMLIHAINPYGYKYLRRVNEDNIDLNRNFHVDFNQKPNAGDYARFNQLLNPVAGFSRFDAFTLKAYLYICRFGIKSLRQSISSGQYDFPKGLFYGGRASAQSTRLMQQILKGLRNQEKEIIHIDIHTGLGKFADHKLLLAQSDQSLKRNHYLSKFDADKIELIGQHQGVSSKLSGTISDYFSQVMGENYFHLGLEFGTYSNIRLLKALRLENAAHHYLDDNDVIKKKIKAEILECFCPADPQWRKVVVNNSLKIIDHALR